MIVPSIFTFSELLIYFERNLSVILFFLYSSFLLVPCPSRWSPCRHSPLTKYSDERTVTMITRERCLIHPFMTGQRWFTCLQSSLGWTVIRWSVISCVNCTLLALIALQKRYWVICCWSTFSISVNFHNSFPTRGIWTFDPRPDWWRLFTASDWLLPSRENSKPSNTQSEAVLGSLSLGRHQYGIFSGQISDLCRLSFHLVSRAKEKLRAMREVGWVRLLGWFSSRTGTSDDDWKAQGIAWILL